MCWPATTKPALISGSVDGVVVTMMSAPATAFAAIGLGAHDDAELFAQGACRRLRLGGIARPDARLGDRPHQHQRLELQPGLHAGAEDRGNGGIRPRQMFRRDRAGGGGADIGEIAIVEQQRLDQPGSCRQQHHHAVDAGQAELRIVEEAGADLDGEAVDARHIGRLHIDLAAMLGNVEPQDRRHRHRQSGQRAESVLDAGDGVEIERHDLAQFGSR